MERNGILTLLIALTMSMTGTASARSQLQSDEQREEVLRADLDHLHIVNLEVDVLGDMLRLQGTADSLFVKNEARTIASKAPGVEEVFNDLDVAKVENGARLESSILEKLEKDRHYTMYDLLEVSVQDGVVTLVGSMAPGGDPAAIEETVSKVRGVRAVENDVRMLPYSASDERLREAIAATVADALGGAHLVRTELHIVVENGDVTLAGLVHDDQERNLVEENARNTKGALSVTNLIAVG